MIIEIERFVTTVQKGSLTEAVKTLHITQPALSLSLARLEQTLGMKLFKRDGKHLVLTKEGDSFYSVAERILLLWKTAKTKNGIAPTIHIGLYDNAALKLSKYFKKTFLKNHLPFEITIDRSSTILHGLTNGIFDIGICILPQEYNFPKNITLVNSFPETLFPVTKKGWKGKTIPFILYNKGSSTRTYIDQTFLINNIKPNIIVESTDTNFMKELAMSGVGVALLPKNVVERELKSKRLVIQKFPFTFKREIGIFTSEGSHFDNTLIREIEAALSA